ncbi:MAG TPA: hypothetical protein VK611_25665 [Acidimicrobiales bacterium]|nr:hypothetical protein [Acidimicrobiales bacterium]
MTSVDVSQEHLLLGLAAYGLAGSVVETHPGPFEPDEWFHFVRACDTHGLVGILATAADRGAVTLSDAQAEELAVREREVAGLSLLVEQRVVRVSSLLSAAGLAHRLIDGPARARLGYRDPGTRTFRSATLLVDPAGAALVAPLMASTPARLQVRSSVTSEDAAVVVGQMSDPPTLLTLADRHVPTASVEEHLVLACIEVLAAPVPDLVVMRDLAELALFPAIDPERVRVTADAWGVPSVVTHALAETWRTFELADRTALSVWAARDEDQQAHNPRSRRPGGVMGRMARRT